MSPQTPAPAVTGAKGRLHPPTHTQKSTLELDKGEEEWCRQKQTTGEDRRKEGEDPEGLAGEELRKRELLLGDERPHVLHLEIWPLFHG